MAISIDEYIERGRKAQKAIEDYTQEQVDELVFAGAQAIYNNADWLAKEAVEETGLGCYEDKIAKNTDTPLAFWDYLKDKKSVGIIEEDPSIGLVKIAHPVGVIAGITPATNPTVTPLGNFMHTMKGKNALIISPAPRAQKTSTDTVNLIRKALKEHGAPEDLIQILDEVTLKRSQEVMAKADLVIATGSSGLTKAAYSSGTPAYGVGPGNPPTIIDRGYDLKDAVAKSIVAIGSDNGILCDGTNMLLYPGDEKKAVLDEFRAQGVAVIEDPETVKKFGDVLFGPDRKPNPELVGKDANVIAKAAGVEIPENTKVIALLVDAVGSANVLNKEIMGPIVVMKDYDKFEDGVAMAIQNMEESGGIGHTAGIYSDNKEHINYYIERIPVARVLINQPTPDAWGPVTNALSPAVSEGCGTWGNNILCGNVDYIHMLNVSSATYPLDVEVPDGDKIFK